MVAISHKHLVQRTFPDKEFYTRTLPGGAFGAGVVATGPRPRTPDERFHEEDGPSVVGKVYDKVVDVGNTANFGLFLGEIGLGGVAAGAGLVSRTSTRMGFPGIAGGAASVQTGITGFTGKTFSEALSKVPGASAVGGGLQKAFDWSGGVLEKAATVTGLKNNRVLSNARASEKILGGIPPLVASAEKYRASLPNGVVRAADDLVAHIRGAAHPGALDPEVVKNFRTAVSEAKIVDKEARVATKVYEKIARHVTRSHGLHASSESWKQIGKTVSEVPGGIGSSRVLTGAMNAAFVGTSVVQMAGGARTFTQGVTSLKQLYADIKGVPTKSVSTWDVLFSSSAPASVRDARKQLWETSVLGQLSDATSLVLSLKMARKGNLSIASFLVPQAVEMGAKVLIGGSYLADYDKMKTAHAHGQRLSADDYAQLLGQACKDIAARGGSDSPFAAALGQQYAEANASPQQVMQEINNGVVTKRVMQIIAANTPTPAPSVAPQPEQSHVEALTQSKRGERPTVGTHTAMINERLDQGIQRV
jgi:hypothetical protein